MAQLAATYPKVKLFGLVREAEFYLHLTTVVSILASIASFGYYYNQGLTLAYGDSQSHLMIARRISDSVTPGFAQLGGVWPPLPHLLEWISMVWIDPIYHTGVGGSFVSMASYVVTVVFLYKSVLLLTESFRGRDEGAAFIGAMTFALNPDVLYMQSTSMTELLLFATMSTAVYFLLWYSQSPSKYLRLVPLGVSLFLADMTRYEGIVLTFTVTAVMVYILLRNRGLIAKPRCGTFVGRMVFAGYWPFAGVAMWILWNGVIFGDPLNFLRGEYANPANWVGERELTTGNWLNSVLAYLYATWDIVSIPTLVLAGLGLIYLVYQTRLSPRGVAVLALLFPVPFFIVTLYGGERPIHVQEFGQNPYNVRFALQMVLIIAILVGFIAQRRVWMKILVGGVAISGIALTLWTNNITTLNEAVHEKVSTETAIQGSAAEWLANNYHGGLILIEGYGNTYVQFKSRIPLSQFLYEGSYRLFGRALQEPVQYVDYVYMRYGSPNPDKVAKAFDENPEGLDGFTLVYQSSEVKIFQRTTTE